MTQPIDQPAGTRTRTITWEDPRTAAQAGAAMAGIEYLRAMAAGQVPRPPIGITMGFEIGAIEEGRVVFEANPAEFHYNPIGVVHGGLALTLCDSAMGCAVHSLLPTGASYTTLEVKVNFVRALTAETGRIRCEGVVVHAGRTVATAEARITDAAGKLYAHGTSTCMIFRPA